MEAVSPSKLDLRGGLKPSVASIPLFPGFPGLGGPRKATPPRGGSVVTAEAKTANNPLYLCSFIDWLTNQRSPFELARSGRLDRCLPGIDRAEPTMRV